MPSNVIKTDRDEHLWSKAKSIVGKQYPDVSAGSDKYYQLVMGVYKKMKPAGIEKESKAKQVKNAKKLVSDYLIKPLIAGGVFLGGRSMIQSSQLKQEDLYRQRIMRAQDRLRQPYA